MNKVLIVDDEVLSIEYLKSLSAWKKYGCTEIDSAWIASKALERFKKEHYPVVFMDIRMPGMDGLALSREFLKICPDTVIVIMTAWQEFEYVKEAMQIGVKHFLVKHEITEEKLDEVLSKIFIHMDQQQNYKKAFWNDWLRNLWENCAGTEIPEKGKRRYFLVMFTLRGLAVLPGDTREAYLSEKEIRGLENEDLSILAFSRLESFTYGLFLRYNAPDSGRNQQEVILEFLNQIDNICKENGDLSPVFFPTDLKASAQAFDETCKIWKSFSHSMLWSRKRVIWERELAHYQRLETDFFKGKAPEEWNQEDLKKMLEKGSTGKFFVRLSALTPVKTFLLHSVGEEFLHEQEKKSALISVEQLLKLGLDFLESGAQRKNGMVKQTVAYIRTHYSEDISSFVIAEKLHVSDGYLRALFKKECSCTIKDYIQQYRIERAKELLLKDEKKIYEIAEQCGFASSQHFSRVFHQLTGMTPGEYKTK